MIELQHLCKSFSQGGETQEVLKDVSFTVAKGSICGIIGMSGAGKSTLLRLVGLLDAPTSGRIIVSGQELGALRGREKLRYYRSIGTVFQGYNLLMQRTVRENVAFPMKLGKYDKKEVSEKSDRLLALVGLSDKADMPPARLSGGQKQRVAIARALANDPSLLLCDEPTSALDSMTTDSILQLLRDINRRLGVTILIITHEIQVVRSICDQVAVLDGGRLVDFGTVAALSKNADHAVTRELFAGHRSVSCGKAEWEERNELK